MIPAKPLHGFHAFLFPFEWKQQGKEKEHWLLEEQTDIALIRTVMDRDAARWAGASSWASRPSTLIQYNEANYFYDFVRPVLYGDTGDTRFQVYYKHRETDGAHYVITLRDGTEYRLELDDIGLSFYNMGVGILSFHCYNREYGNPDDILKINQFGRRLYPPFYGTDTTKTGTQAFFEQDDWAAALGRSEKEFARSIRLERHGAPWITEDFAAWERQPELGALPELVRLLLPPDLTRKIKLTPVLDDRMFVVSWAGNDHLADTIRSWDKNDERDWWYKFLFVDGGQKTCQNEEMTRRQLEAHSNVRWMGYGTLYGVSRYSFVCLTGSLEHLLKPYVNAAFLVSHMQTVYFKLAELALVQRACLLRFSDEVTAIARMDRGDKALIAKAGSLTRQYIRFINKVYFREVTAQEQGIELYNLLLEHMRTDRYVQDLDREIQELHQYINLEEEKRRNEKLDMLTYLGAFFVVPSFVCTYLGINDFDLEKHIGVTALLCLLSASSVFAIIRSAGRWRTFFILAAFALMVFILFVFPHGKFT